LLKDFFSRAISASGCSVAGVFGRPLLVIDAAEFGREREPADPGRGRFDGDPISRASRTVGK
jgi:hypothetical protein